MIPKVIMQTSKHKPNLYRVLKIKEICEGWEYEHYTDEDIVNFLETYPDPVFPQIIDLFCQARCKPHKADLFRYYYLYKKGGVYMDTDIIPHVNIEKIIQNYKFISVTTNDVQAFNGFICATPKHKIMFLALRHAYNTLMIDKHPVYHIFCRELMHIVNTLKDSTVNMQLTEHIANDISEIKNSEGEVILTHYFKHKVFPVTFITRSDDYVNY